MFNLNINRLLLWLLPYFLRKPATIAYLKALCLPFRQQYDAFMIKRDYDLYRLANNSQVFSMVKVLNDAFDNTDRRIFITDGLTKARTFIYTPKETKYLQLGTAAIYNPQDYADSGTDFIVWVPNVFAEEDLIRMRAEVDYYRLPSKRYMIYSYE